MILTTGGAGYIGSHTLIDLIENTDFQLVSCDNFSNSNINSFNRVERITDRKVKNYNIDLTNLEKTRKIFKENDIKGIIHFAAFKAVGESVEDPAKYYKNNLVSLINLLDCCKEFNVSNFIFSSSCTVYGQPKKLPVIEESEVQGIESPYGNTKKIGEEILKDFCKVNPWFNAIALRYFNPVGAHVSGLNGELPTGIPNNLVPFITQTAAGLRKQLTVFGDDYSTRDGSCIRDYIHVSDIAHAHTLALEYLLKSKTVNLNYEVFNLGTGKGVTVLEVINAFEESTGLKLNYTIGKKRPGDVEAVYSDSKKAKDVLGWIPKYDIKDMMKSAWKWELQLRVERVKQ